MVSENVAILKWGSHTKAKPRVTQVTSAQGSRTRVFSEIHHSSNSRVQIGTIEKRFSFLLAHSKCPGLKVLKVIPMVHRMRLDCSVEHVLFHAISTARVDSRLPQTLSPTAPSENPLKSRFPHENHVGCSLLIAVFGL